MLKVRGSRGVQWKISLVTLFLVGSVLTGCGGTNTNYYKTGMEKLGSKDFREAAENFSLSIENEERLPESYRGLGISKLKEGNNADAIAAFSRSLNSLENNNEDFEKDVLLYLAEARIGYGQYDKAIEVYRDYLAIEKDPEVYFRRARLYLELGKEKKAQEDFDQALKDSRDYQMYMRIAKVYDDKKAGPKADAYLERAAKISPKSAEDQAALGQVYFQMKDYDKAVESLQKAIKEGNKNARILLGRVYLTQDDPASARAMYKEALSEKDQAEAYNGLALCAIYDKNYDQALSYITKGLKGKDPEARQSLLFNEIVAYEKKLDFKKAKEKMEAYLKAYPDDEEAEREATFLKTR